MKSIKRRLLPIFTLMLSCALLLTSCAGNTPADNGGGSAGNNSAAQGGTSTASDLDSEYITPGTIAAAVDEAAESSKDTLTLRMASDPGSLSPIGTSSYALEMLSLVSMPLLWPTDPGGKGDTLVWTINEKSLLDAYEWSDDNMTLYLTIKQGVKFSTGEEVKASDVVFSMQTIYDGYTNAAYMDVDNIKATGDYTLEIPMVSLNISFVSTLGLYYTFSEKAYNACSDPEATFLTSPDVVGCGPYKVIEWASGDHVLMERNEHYVNGPVKIQYVNVRFISEHSVATMELESGGVDVVEEPLWEDFKVVSEGGYGEGIAGWQSGGLYLTQVGFNATSMFSDYNVRRAFCLALDKEEIYNGAWDGYGLNSYTVMGTAFDNVKDYKDNWPLARDLETAKQLLADAGYPEGFHCRVIYNGDANQGLALQIMKRQLAEVGIDLEILAYDSATYKDMMENETDTWELWVRKWGSTGNPGTMISSTFAQIMHFSDAEGGAEVIDYAERMTGAPSTEEYVQIFEEFQDRFWDDYLFWYPLQMQSYTTLYNSSLQGASRIYVFFDFDNAYFA